MKKKCKLWFCDYKHYARGLCQKHYQTWLRHGSPLSPNQEDILRANSMIALGRQVVGELLKYVEDESLLNLMHTFLNNTSEDYKQESNLPACDRCELKPIILTDGKTFVVKSCDCENNPIPVQQLFGDLNE